MSNNNNNNNNNNIEFYSALSSIISRKPLLNINSDISMGMTTCKDKIIHRILFITV